ncbi:MAG: hypothetical protein AB7F66_07295 [Bacteriovoracia bacterium]
MFRMIGWIFRATLVTLAVLVFGNAVSLRGRTVSEHVRVQMNEIGKTSAAARVRRWLARESNAATKPATPDSVSALLRELNSKPVRD